MMNKQIGNFGELREQVLGDRNYEGTVWNLGQKTTSLSKVQVSDIEKIKATLVDSSCYLKYSC